MHLRPGPLIVTIWNLSRSSINAVSRRSSTSAGKTEERMSAHYKRWRQLCSIEASIIKNQLRWSGHVVRMPDQRLPKQIFYSEPVEGKRSRVGQKKHFKDVLKVNLKKCSINVTLWEETAKDRPLWRTTISKRTATFEVKRCKELEEKRRCRKERQQPPQPALPPGTSYPQCGRAFWAKIGLISHLRNH